MKYKRFEDLPVWQAGLTLSVDVFELTTHRLFRRQGDLANQIQRAALSVPNNIAEGFERGTTQDLVTFLYYARGSAGEVRSILAVATRLAALAEFRPQLAKLGVQAEGISRQLAAWLKSLKETEIRGDRYLTEGARKAREQKTARTEFLAGLRRNVEAARLRRTESQIQDSRSQTSEPDGRE
jgi:four helix bundle protein